MSDAIKSLKADTPSDEQRWKLRVRSLKLLKIADDAVQKATAMDPYTYSHVSEQMDTLLGVLVPHASPLGMCAREIHLLTRVTGLSGVAEYVLAGVRPRPLRPRFYIEESGLIVDDKHRQWTQVKGWPTNNGNGASWVRFPRIKIELDACLVTESEFREIYAAVRKSVGLKHQRPTIHRDRLLIATVQRHGGLPRDHPNKASFWNAVVADSALKGLFPSAAATREAYHRALRRAARASG